MKKILSLMISISLIGCSTTANLQNITSLSDLDLCVASIQASNRNKNVFEEEILNRNLNCEEFGKDIEIAILQEGQKSSNARIYGIIAGALIAILIDAQSENKYPIF
jgi:hypothetical protein